MKKTDEKNAPRAKAPKRTPRKRRKQDSRIEAACNASAMHCIAAAG